MTTFYSIHVYDQNATDEVNQDRINNKKLYTTFEKACDDMDKKIKWHIDYWNDHDDDGENFERPTRHVFEQPNREEKKEEISKSTYVHYYQCESGWLWVICKWEVVE